MVSSPSNGEDNGSLTFCKRTVILSAGRRGYSWFEYPEKFETCCIFSFVAEKLTALWKLISSPCDGEDITGLTYNILSLRKERILCFKSVTSSPVSGEVVTFSTSIILSAERRGYHMFLHLKCMISSPFHGRGYHTFILWNLLMDPVCPDADKTCQWQDMSQPHPRTTDVTGLENAGKTLVFYSNKQYFVILHIRYHVVFSNTSSYNM